MGRWSMYAFDPSETAMVGKRSRECVAKGQTELDCVQRDGRARSTVGADLMTAR